MKVQTPNLARCSETVFMCIILLGRQRAIASETELFINLFLRFTLLYVTLRHLNILSSLSVFINLFRMAAKIY
jgi:hypothetical protein